ncbi:kinase-like protein [Coniochaeta ligniaria NRRL 30616]|uniref:Kinase-like protein n=1 Tax=Coniochaeta ligniaria NRRL 30616 TaxID=1408157 RepID=A0A1J7J5H7_9PEZI|nr:kinase-like protein [Coniochaeta ligniaria NRRL 30616]
MTSNTQSQGWPTAFGDSDIEPHTPKTSRFSEEPDRSNKLSDVIIAMRHELTFIKHRYLKPCGRLGRGSSFEVNKALFTLGDQSTVTPHLVAVKSIITTPNNHDTDKLRAVRPGQSRLFISVIREVRVLTHPKLRDHGCLVSAIGWGWTDGGTSGTVPYLVMQYSDRGSLAYFSKQRSVTVGERHLLALDVAMGLRALHDCNIVHGDVKPENVLVYDSMHREYANEDELPFAERPFVAKLADFGCAIFEKDLDIQDEYYLGTPKYNAPEISGLLRDDAKVDHKLPSKFEQFKAADCYSFGLLLWETVKKGDSFVDSTWLVPGESAVEFVQRAFHVKEDALLDLSIKFFNGTETKLAGSDSNEGDPEWLRYRNNNPTRQQMANHVAQWPHLRGHLDEYDTPSHAKSFETFRHTVSLCLRDSLCQRGTIHEIVKVLSKDMSNNVPRGGIPTVKILHHDPTFFDRDTASQREWLMKLNLQQSATLRGIRLLESQSQENKLTLRIVPTEVAPDPSLQVIKHRANGLSKSITLTPRAYASYCYGMEDMFKAALREQLPWENQCEAADHIQRAVEAERDPERKAQARLQLAIMYHLGYGLAPDSSEALRQLKAATHNKVAQEIFEQVRAAIEPDEQGHKEQVPVCSVHDVQRQSESENEDLQEDKTLDLGSINVASFDIFAILLRRGRYEPHEMTEALTAACRDAHLDAAMLLARHCTDLSTMNRNIPNPLHWLIMFRPGEATKMLQLIVTGPAGSDEVARLKEIRSLLAAAPAQVTVLLPHRCMELHGTPLHWAVTAGFIDLVEAFICLGADVNTRFQSQKSVHDGPEEWHNPSLSPLDIAAHLHFPQIVNLLLDHGSEVYGGDWYWSHSPLHMLGYMTLPFARYVGHGPSHRAALQATIRTLLDRGLDINDPDSLGQTPLYIAVKNIDLEPYILEELLAAGAKAGAECEKREGSILCSAIVCCAQRRHSCWKVPLLLPQVSDINACNFGERGMNALHLCAVFDAEPAAEILLRTAGIDVNAESRLGDTAVLLAATRGSLGVLASLIRKGANLELGDALHGAVHARQLDAVLMLVTARASVRFTTSKGGALNILHSAVSTDEKRPSHVREYLAKCPEARTEEVMNEFSSNGWTPLHQAAYYGDVDGVAALLEAGADPRKFKLPATFTLGGTPRELATKIRESATLFLHPRPRQEYEGEEMMQRPGFTPSLALMARGDNRFEDYLDEIIVLLRRAELSVASQESISSFSSSPTTPSESFVLVMRPSEGSI